MTERLDVTEADGSKWVNAGYTNALEVALRLFVSQWNACGPNSDFGRYFQNVKWAADIAFGAPQESNVCPDCHGHGGQMTTESGATVHYCNCPVDGAPNIFDRAQHSWGCHLKAGGPNCTCSTTKAEAFGEPRAIQDHGDPIAEIRDNVLHMRGPLEGYEVDSDIINAVLSIIDDATPPKWETGMNPVVTKLCSCTGLSGCKHQADRVCIVDDCPNSSDAALIRSAPKTQGTP